MYDADKSFQAFIRGDFHPTGWKSQWRTDLEKRMAEDQHKAQLRIVTAKQIQVRQGKPQRLKYYASLSEDQRKAWRTRANERRARLVAEGLCRDCGGKRERLEVQNCDGCLKKRYGRQKRDRMAA